MEDALAKALRENPSKCLDCNEFRWCPHKVWVGEPKECFYILKEKEDD